MAPVADLRADPWAFGPWCWIVDDVRLFDTPLPTRGMQGLWPISLARTVDALDALAGDRQPWSALTLLQPYATAIALGPKRVENRPWRRRIPRGGLWVGLHAGRGLYDGAAELVDEWREAPDALFPQCGIWPEAPDLAAMPRGALLGVMHVARIDRFPESAPLFAEVRRG